MGLGKTIQLIALLLHERGGSAVPQHRALAVAEARKEATEASDEPKPQDSSSPSVSLIPLLHQPVSHSPALPRIGPTLLFAPTSVVGNWVRELQRFRQTAEGAGASRA